MNNINENYLSKLEDIVECQIHLGIMKNPKILSCNHSFCYECLRKLKYVHNNLICPLCRNIEPISNIDNLPPAIMANKLIGVIDEIKIGTMNNEEVINLNNDSKMNSSEFIVEQIEENMKNESHYRLVNRKERQEFYQHISEEVSFSNFAVTISDLNFKQIIYVDSHTSQFTVYSPTSIQKFSIILHDTTVIPEYIRIFGHDLVLTGKLKTDNQISSVFLLCDFQGKIIYQSKLFTNSNESGLPTMLGFDFNEIDQIYYLCMPENNTINFYDSSFVENDENYDLNENIPEFVAFHSTGKQLFVSCPQNKRILILNIENSSIKTISTDQIIPKMIFSTDDEKILFFDSKEKRIIWIKIICEDLFSKKLDFVPLNKELEITFFTVLPTSKIFISTFDEIYLFQLEKKLSYFKFCNLS